MNLDNISYDDTYNYDLNYMINKNEDLDIAIKIKSNINLLFIDINVFKNIDNYNFLDYFTENKIGIIIHNSSELIYISQHIHFTKISSLLIDCDLLNNEDIHAMYFVHKKIYVNYNPDNNNNFEYYQKLILNPCVYCILINNYIFDTIIPKLYTEIKYQYQIPNLICHINIKKIINHIQYNDINQLIKDMIHNVWGKFLIYNISNIPETYTDIEIKKLYFEIGKQCGEIQNCKAFNSESVDYDVSRDIKYIPNINHFYASNIRQPLHTDYAYYEKDNSPDWLILYSLKVAEWGGITSLISTKTLTSILKKYEYNLYEKLNRNITYVYKEDGYNIKHNKVLLNDKNIINWNKFQIDESNDNEIKEICHTFFNFLENKIVGGNIYDISKSWNRGDCVIFNDHLVLHCRSAFYGERWLKDHAIYDKNMPLD
jgi:alpha-ketoglutarate-dependent taurine dioxygenase